MNIGKKIHQARKDIGITQKDLAKEMDVHWNTVARWERNEIECRMDQLEKIAEITNRPVAWFLGQNDLEEGKVYVEIDGVKFQYAREKNKLTVKELAVFLEIPEKKIKEIEEKKALIEMEIVHRMVFVLGYPCSWFFTSKSNKDWAEKSEIYLRWLETGKEKWTFQDYFYDLWEKGKKESSLGADDIINWLRKISETWKNLSQDNPRAIAELEPLAKKLADSTKGETAYFTKRRKEAEKQRKTMDETFREMEKAKGIIEEN